MLASTIKECLGESLSRQVEKCLKGKGKNGKDIICVVGNDGTFVPAEKYHAEKQKRKEAEKWIEEVSKLFTQIEVGRKEIFSRNTLSLKNQKEKLESDSSKVEKIEIFLK